MAEDMGLRARIMKLDFWPVLRRLPLALLLSALALPGVAQQQAEKKEDRGPVSIEELLGLVSQGRVVSNAQEAARIQQFEQRRGRRQAELDKVLAELEVAYAETDRLEVQINRNKEAIAALRRQRDEAFGALKEAFGNLQAAAQENAVELAGSVTTGELGHGRVDFLLGLAKELEDSDRLPDVRRIERMWFELLREMPEQSRVTRFTTQVRADDGSIRECEVVRVGSYGVICDGRYAVIGAEGVYSELPRQPAGRFVSTAGRMQDADQGDLLGFGIDPTGPQGNTLLKNLIQSPTIEERIGQGGIVGYIIISLGVIGVVLAILKLIGLSLTGAAVNRQIKSGDSSDGNPLGRVLQVYEKDPQADLDTLETRLAEAIASERPKIERYIGFLKVIATVAPLLGLLGTVTGMIITFQAITLYGTGDPKTMAGGISTALVTTVLGLCVAVPTVLLHAIVHSRARSVIEVIEQRSLGVVARRAEELGRKLGG